MKISAIIACAGIGERANLGKNKLLADLGGVTVLERTLNAFYSTQQFDEIIVVSSKTDLDEITSLCKDKATVIEGGNTRTESVKNALNVVTGDIVLIHDGARPFVSEDIINNCIDSVEKYGSGIVAIPSPDTIAIGNNENIEKTLGKDGLFIIQTPQGFYTADIKKAYSLIGEKVYPDDSAVYSEFIGVPHLSKGSTENKKLTFREDFERDYLIGEGFDCHRLVEGRKLILGGITIPHDKGLLGHSDADALTHAIMDALLSAVSERDIGYHFPDTDEKYKGADSLILLDRVLEIVKSHGYNVKNVSAVIMAEKPKLLKHIPTIRETLAKRLGITPDRLGITATTLEGLGFVGREEGICVRATCLLTKN